MAHFIEEDDIRCAVATYIIRHHHIICTLEKKFDARIHIDRLGEWYSNNNLVTCGYALATQRVDQLLLIVDWGHDQGNKVLPTCFKGACAGQGGDPSSNVNGRGGCIQSDNQIGGDETDKIVHSQVDPLDGITSRSQYFVFPLDQCGVEDQA